MNVNPMSAIASRMSRSYSSIELEMNNMLYSILPSLMRSQSDGQILCKQKTSKTKQSEATEETIFFNERPMLLIKTGATSLIDVRKPPVSPVPGGCAACLIASGYKGTVVVCFRCGAGGEKRTRCARCCDCMHCQILEADYNSFLVVA